jgi:hypothetical protein
MNQYEYQYELRKLLQFLYDAMIKKDEQRIKELKDKIEFLYRTQGLNNENWVIRRNNRKPITEDADLMLECAGEHL